MSGCSSCSCGYLKVRDGSSANDPLLGEYCGSVSYGTVTSTGNHLFVVFYSDYSSSRFRATVKSNKGNFSFEFYASNDFLQITIL